MLETFGYPKGINSIQFEERWYQFNMIDHNWYLTLHNYMNPYCHWDSWGNGMFIIAPWDLLVKVNSHIYTYTLLGFPKYQSCQKAMDILISNSIVSYRANIAWNILSDRYKYFRDGSRWHNSCLWHHLGAINIGYLYIGFQTSHMADWCKPSAPLPLSKWRHWLHVPWTRRCQWRSRQTRHLNQVYQVTLFEVPRCLSHTH